MDAGRLEIATLLIEHGADVDARLGTAFGGGGGETALIEAAQGGKAAMLSLLIENKADLDAQDQYGQTALHRAAFNGMLLIVQLLVQAGCKTDIKDVEGILAVQKTPHCPPCPCFWFAASPCSRVQPSALQRYRFRLPVTSGYESGTDCSHAIFSYAHLCSPSTIPTPLTTLNLQSHTSSSVFPLNHPYGNNLNIPTGKP